MPTTKLPDSENIAVDPYLNTHRIKNDTDFVRYDASGFYRPISIKDQMIRVSSIVYRAHKQGIISDSRPLLVIGGGMAGIVAAVKASELQVKTLVIEKKVTLSNIACTSQRFICPTQYDWTASHWSSKEFPPPLCGEAIVPGKLNLTAGTAVKFAQQLDKISNNDPNIKRWDNTTLIKLENISGGDPTLNATVEKNGKDRELTGFGMALSCLGFGKERVTADGDSYRGIEFWSLEKHNDLINDEEETPNIVICGSGDGALQDFIELVTTEKRVGDIYLNLKSLPGLEEMFDNIEDKISRAEEEARRKEIWFERSEDIRKCKALKRLQSVHKKAITSVLANDDVQKCLDGILRKDKASDKLIAEKVKLAHPCDHFSFCYPLNRFVTLLLLEHLRNKYGLADITLDKRKAKLVTPADGHSHDIDHDLLNSVGEPSELSESEQLRYETERRKLIKCRDGKHTVEWEGSVCAGTSIGIAADTIEYGTVILRLGLDVNKIKTDVSALMGSVPAFQGAQILPYS